MRERGLRVRHPNLWRILVAYGTYLTLYGAGFVVWDQPTSQLLRHVPARPIGVLLMGSGIALLVAVVRDGRYRLPLTIAAATYGYLSLLVTWTTIEIVVDGGTPPIAQAFLSYGIIAVHLLIIGMEPGTNPASVSKP